MREELRAERQECQNGADFVRGDTVSFRWVRAIWAGGRAPPMLYNDAVRPNGTATEDSLHERVLEAYGVMERCAEGRVTIGGRRPTGP
jgi:hypothetical protein